MFHLKKLVLAWLRKNLMLEFDFGILHVRPENHCIYCMYINLHIYIYVSKSCSLKIYVLHMHILYCLHQCFTKI